MTTVCADVINIAWESRVCRTYIYIYIYYIARFIFIGRILKLCILMKSGKCWIVKNSRDMIDTLKNDVRPERADELREATNL